MEVFQIFPERSMQNAKKRVVEELKEINKPFIIIMNCLNPEAEESVLLCEELSNSMEQTVIPVNCLELSEKDIKYIMTQILFAFPIKEINIRMEKWITGLAKGHWLKDEIFSKVRGICAGY